jgi:hypothetical protein
VSEPRKPAPRIQWETIERSAAKGDLARLDAMNEAELDEELRAGGIDPAEAARVVERAMKEGVPPAGKDAPAPAADEAAKQPPALRAIAGDAPAVKAPAKASRVLRWGPWVGAAAIAAGTLLVLMNRDDGNTAGGRRGPPPEEIGETREEVSRPPAERAARLRDRALMACNARHWEACTELLDRAQGLDPPGEDTPLVRDLRRQLADVQKKSP